MNNHTPGPWASYAVPSSDLYNIRNISGPNAEHIGVVACPVAPYDMPQGEALANARLIAAAPDLLAALQRVIVYHVPKVNPLSDAAILSARQAIARATE